VKIAVLLDTMWGGRRGRAPRHFRINPDNFSGRRLYRICGADADLLVTNSCRELVNSTAQKGVPDPQWVAENLALLEGLGCNVLLVCGKVAQKTFRESGYKTAMQVIETLHPAARCWTVQMMDHLSTMLGELKRGDRK